MAVREATGSELLAWLREREGEMVELLERLAAAESPTTAPELQLPALEILAAELTKLGYLVRYAGTPSAGLHLYARPRERDAHAPRQLLVGHSDTVWPLGTLGRMPIRTESGRLYGPGVYDMKGGLVQAVFALRALAEGGHALPATPVLFVNGDEERGSPSSTRFLRLLARGAARAFVLEPAAGAAGKLKTGRKGAGRFAVAVRGLASHAGTEPEAGVSAILELSHQVQRLFELNDPERGVTVNVGTVDGGLQPNVVAPEARAVVDVRVPTSEDAEAVERAIRTLRPLDPGVTIAVEGGFGRPPMPPTPRNRDVWRRAQEAGRELGLELEEAPAVGGASDGNTTSLYTATLDGLGPIGAGAHADHEHVVVSSLPERAALLALLLASPLPAETSGVAVARAREALDAVPRSLKGAVLGSIARTARLDRRAAFYVPLPREEWAEGDYVVGEVLRDSYQIETTIGRGVEVIAGDLVVGALGRRFATLEVTGDWRDIGDDLRMDALSRSGVFGRCSSVAPSAVRFMAPLRYRGHVFVRGRREGVRDHVEPVPPRELVTPTVLIVGTSMDAGKTTSAKRIIRLLKERGLRVGGVKLTGVGRYRDILAMQDAGADVILDFVDAGLPSTICGEEEFRTACRHMLSRLAAAQLDVVVAEAGASPLEPYQGDVAVEEVGDAVACTILCASDPYAVVGVMQAFHLRPDLVAGRATSTDAGVALVEKLAGVRAMNILDPDCGLDGFLAEQLGLERGRPSDAGGRSAL
ncbi:MAG TPA: M20/M25/M40 family metallo-hydrolase [Gaiellaceae bacterium]|nr:M20/M25/M40 family metallo-hydrolase [Gaiellaceae bacterium]